MAKKQTLESIHTDAMAEFSNIQSALRDERLQCLQDRRFYSIAGAQWEGPLGEQFAIRRRLALVGIHLVGGLEREERLVAVGEHAGRRVRQGRREGER